jgi:hypothetical protein
VRIDLPELLQALARHLAQRGVAGEPTRRTLVKSPTAQDGKARHIALSSTSAMRVCQPAPVAFQRASVSGGSRIEIAVRALPDFGRPRGLSIVLAMLAPRISGNTSAAGRALEKVAFVHSGFSWIFRLVLGLRFIAFGLAWIGFSQADYVDIAGTWREHKGIEAPFDNAKRLKAVLSVVLAEIFNHKRRVPLELLHQIERNSALRNISFVLGGVEAYRHDLLYRRIYDNATTPLQVTS